jgi:Fatty acid desaturase
MLVALAGAHAAVLIAAPTAAVIAIGLWWNANTISHYFIHRPFFQRRSANRAFAAFLSVLLGFPHALWRNRHLAHHAGVSTRTRLSGELAVHTALVLLLWMATFAAAPLFFLSVYLPGWAAGLLLCAAHGYYEHAHGTTSHYGWIYNLLLFNDGYHAEHHANPTTHWTQLPAHQDPAARVSRWPAPMRWLESDGLVALERLALRSPALQRFLVRVHEHAFRDLLSRAACLEGRTPRIAIIGGGLFPRTALVLRRLIPEARLIIIDDNAAHLDVARRWFEPAARVSFVHARFPAASDADRTDDYDIVVLPLSFEGDRDAMYARPPARAVIVHDWFWRRRGISRVISLLLLKRINLVEGRRP